MRLHVLLHGWLSHKRFQRHMAPWVDLAAQVGDICMFPCAPGWSQSWNRQGAEALADRLAKQRLPPCDILLIGHSDGATWVHAAAQAISRRLRADRNPIAGLVHYAGLWHDDITPFSRSVPSVFVVGERDWLAGVWHSPWRDTHQAAARYGREVLVGAGGHRWDHRNNSEIAARLGL